MPVRIRRSRDPRSGFTLIELLIVVAILGILAAMLVPNLMHALQKAKQKRTMADIRFTGTAMMAWLTDQVAASAAGASVDLTDYPLMSREDLTALLVDQYVQEVPVRDGWKNPYEYRLDPRATNVAFAIRSGGRDRTFAADSYSPFAFDPTDYDQDIVWTDGFFVRWPQRLTN